MLLLIVALLVVAPLGGFGTYLGIPDAINHDDTVKRVVVGCSLSVLWLAVLYCGYLLWLQDCRDKRVDPPPNQKAPAAGPPSATTATTEAPVAAPGASPLPAPDPALDVGFCPYALKVSACFSVALVGIVVLVPLLNWVAVHVADILHNPLPVMAAQKAPELVEDDGVEGCEESLVASSATKRILSLWLAFLVTTIVLVLLYWLLTRGRPLPTPPRSSSRRAWRLAWIVSGVLLFGLAFYSRSGLWGPVAVAILFLFWALAHWLRSPIPQNPAPHPAAQASRWKVVRVLVSLAVYLESAVRALKARIQRDPSSITVDPASGWKVIGVILVIMVYLFGFVYLPVTWLLSQDWVLGWAGALFFIVLTRLLMRVWATPLKAVQTALGFPRDPSAPDGEKLARQRGWRLALLGIGFYILICALPFTKSPGTFICLFLFGLVLAHGLLSLFLHRAVFAVAVMLLVLFVFSGVQAYHFRFPGLGYWYHQDRLQLLTACEKEAADQKCLDREMGILDHLVKANGTIKTFGEAQDELKALQQSEDPQVIQRLGKLLDMADGKVERQTLLDGWNSLKQQELEQAEDRLQKAKKNLGEFLDRVKSERDKLLDDWRQCEHDNRVIPVQIPPRQLRDLLYWPELDRTPAISEPLIPIEDVYFGDQTAPVVVIAVSGGGIRSAAWAYVVLKELETYFARANISFPPQVRLITGASGGMLGASYYVELLGKDPLAFPLPEDAKAREERIRSRETLLRDKYCQHLTKDALTPIVQQMVLGDVPSFFSPWPSKYDRGQALEDAWLENLEQLLDRPFDSFREDEKQAKRPFLVFTPMLVEDGRRLLISNMDLRMVVLNDGNLVAPGTPGTTFRDRGVYSREALELFRLFPQATKDFKLSTAVRMSASFPFFSPAVPLPTAPRRRVVDAGYYDTYGVSLAASWLFSARNADVFRRRTSLRFLLIQIRDTLSDENRALTKIRSEPAISTGRALEEISSPLEGLYNSRDGSSSFRNDGQLELLSQYLINDNTLLFRPPETRKGKGFTVATFELDSPAPLSWYLSDAERNSLWRAIKGKRHQDRLGALVEWWNDESTSQ
jgi:hypothetical protein